MQYDFTVLKGEEIERIHHISLQVLSQVGMKIYDDRLCATLSARGLLIDDHLVRFPRELVSASLEKAPASFYGRSHGE